MSPTPSSEKRIITQKQSGSLFEASNDHSFVGYEPQVSLLNRLFGVGNIPQATCQPSSISALRSIPGTNVWFMTVVEPLSATRSSLRRTLYSTQPATKNLINQKLIDDVHNDFKSDLKFLNQKYIDITSQSTSTASIVGEKSMTHSQTHLLEQIEAHLRQERKAGTQIFPAAQPAADKDGNSSVGGVAERCKIPLSPLSLLFPPPSPISLNLLGLGWN